MSMPNLNPARIAPPQPRWAPSMLHRRDKLNVNCLAHRVDVIDAYTLLRAPSTVAEEDASISAVVDALWSLQYMVPGPLTASAFTQCPLPSPPSPPSGIKNSTHAVHFRFNKEAAFRSFMNHPLTIKAFESAAHEKAIELETLCCRVSVANELETLFRRGDEWEEGLELLVVLGEEPEGGGSSSDLSVRADVEEFLLLMERLATSSAFGAIQAASGEILKPMPKLKREKNSPPPSKIFIARFATEGQLTAFLSSPPVAAMLQSTNKNDSPLTAVWTMVMKSAPAENTKNDGLRRM